MNELTFLLCYLGLILIGSLILTGFYIVTKADKEVEPNMRIRYYGKVLKSWGAFLMKERHSYPIYFCGDQLERKRWEIERTNPKFKGRLSLDPIYGRLNITDGAAITVDDKYSIEMNCRCKVNIDGSKMYLYEERILYVLPEWIRMTLGGCLPCSSSILGSLVYWAFILLQSDVFSWSSRPMLAMFICWIGYCLSLVPVNMIVHRKTF